MSRALRAVLSTENLLHNVSTLKKSAPHSKVLAMVKANAYGHGIRSVSMRIEKEVDAFGVASIDEALALRKVGITKPITLIEGIFGPDELLTASQEGFRVVFHCASQIEWLSQTTLPTPIEAWVKADTGMGRLGFTPEEAAEAIRALSVHPSIAQPVGLMSHFACADEPDNPMNARQIAVFRSMASLTNGPRSLCNGAGILNYPEQHYDWVRPGLPMYGASPVAGRPAEAFGLKPVMTLETKLIAIHQMKKGATLGYGARYTCPEDMDVGVIAVGYGDGYPRTDREGAPVLVNGVECRVAGRVSMDMTTVDLRPYKNAKVGDPVILWGEGLPVERIAEATGRISYDLLSSVQLRVPFHWTTKV